ncbi:HamA C-terminal domain-containing protein [Oceanobacter antarcticus]|uniref:DUF1837 domain-containing protein n=1 Tax=Oceanobacter antarcticus TaxID=3133425 RepID=A0ABW8NIP5_9GAMM
MEVIDTDSLLANTRSLISKMIYLREDYGLTPKNSHVGTAIRFSDLIELHDEFVNELTNGIIRFVYSKEKEEKIVEQLMEEGRDLPSAYSELRRRSHNKFRKSNLKGQFSELLIFYLLQYHFKAVPVLRKMKITTNPALERNGADAIHVSADDGGYKLYLAECKTYDAKGKNFNNALHDSVEDMIEHYLGHRNELNLYTFEDFIPEKLEDIVRSYLEGKSDNIEVNLVCLVAYRNDEAVSGKNQQELNDSSLESIRSAASRINLTALKKKIPNNLEARLHYVLFPIADVDDILNKFTKQI